MIDIKDEANKILLEYYSMLVVEEDLFDAIIILELAKKMAKVHINLLKRNSDNKDYYNDLIKEIEII